MTSLIEVNFIVRILEKINYERKLWQKQKSIQSQKDSKQHFHEVEEIL